MLKPEKITSRTCFGPGLSVLPLLFLIPPEFVGGATASQARMFSAAIVRLVQPDEVVGQGLSVSCSGPQRIITTSAARLSSKRVRLSVEVVQEVREKGESRWGRSGV